MISALCKSNVFFLQEFRLAFVTINFKTRPVKFKLRFIYANEGSKDLHENKPEGSISWQLTHSCNEANNFELLFFAFTICVCSITFRQKEELIKELAKSDKEAKETKKQFSEKIKSMKQELEKAKKELEDSKKTLEEYESKANYEVSEKQKVEAEYKKKLQTVETKLQGLKRKQKVRKSRAVVNLHRE